MPDDPIRFFVDADLMSVGIALSRLRKDVTHPGHPAAMGIEQDTKDPVWLSVVGAEGWLVLTKDRRIRRRPAEIRAVYRSNVRMIVITGNKNMNSFDRFQLLMRFWRDIEEMDAAVGPWIYSLTQVGLRPLCPPWPDAALAP